MNARDVFARRPNCNSLWVVPAEAILSSSEEKLRLTPLDSQTTETTEVANQRYVVFQKQSQRNSMTYVTYSGTIEAGSLEAALREARESFADLIIFVWWVCLESAIARSDVNDIDSMFKQAKDKKYRLPQSYRVLTEMLEAKNDHLLLSDIENS
jgi:ring-1,2-phenylacetyl-CoA epoxidase subunit PaaB